MRETHRSKGVGKLILTELMKLAKQTRCNRIDFNVDKNNSAQTFYKKMGAIDVSERDGHVHYRLFKDVIDKVEM